MADATYQPKVYRKQGGDEQVVASGGTLRVESGASVVLESGSSFTAATPLEMTANLSFTTGANPVLPVQTVSSSATTISAGGYSVITGTTAGPTYLIANPITGVMKFIELAASSSGATHRAIIAPASTGVSFTTTGKNNITLATSALLNVTLVGKSTSAYRVFGVFTSTMGGFGNVTT